MAMRDETIIQKAAEILRRRLRRAEDPEDVSFFTEADRQRFLEWGNDALSFLEYAAGSSVPPAQLVDHINRRGHAPEPRRGWIGVEREGNWPRR